MWCSIAENCLNCRTFGKFNTLEFSLEWLKCFVSHWRFLFTFAFMLLLLMTVYVHLCSTFDCFTLVEGTADVAVWQMWLKLGCWRYWEMEHGQMLVLELGYAWWAGTCVNRDHWWRQATVYCTSCSTCLYRAVPCVFADVHTLLLSYRVGDLILHVKQMDSVLSKDKM